MGRLRSFFKPVSLSASLFALVVLFQNCSSPFGHSSLSSQSHSGTVDVGGVDGMRYIRAGVCADGNTASDVVAVSSDLQSAQYVRQNCQDLSVPVSVAVSSLKFAVNENSVFVLNDGIFTTVQDGFDHAPAGSPQFPNLLNNYVVRPNWYVAGIDYAVGPKTSVFKDPATISIPGVTVDSQAHEIVVNADNITLDGYDFSLNGGWSVVVGEQLPAHNTIIINSKFQVGANKVPMLYGDDASTNLYVGYCIFDNANTPDSLGLASIVFTGNGLTVEYSWLKNPPLDFIDAGAGTIVIRYNLFNNSGQAANTTAADWLQFGSGDHYLVSDFNTFYQTTATTGNGTEGINVSGQVGSWTIQSAEILNNTIVTNTGAKVSDIVNIATAQLFGSVLVRDNFVDPSGSLDFASTGSSCALGSCPASTSASSIFSNNVNMVSGVPFSNNP